MTQIELARTIPHEHRVKIVIDWLPKARPNFGSDEFKMLWEAYFVYIDPDGIRKTDCHLCLNNVLKNWKSMQPHIVEVEKEYNLIEQL